MGRDDEAHPGVAFHDVFPKAIDRHGASGNNKRKILVFLVVFFVEADFAVDFLLGVFPDRAGIDDGNRGFFFAFGLVHPKKTQ